MVKIDDAFVPDGTVITAIVQGNVHTTTTPSIYGNSTYAIVLSPPDGTIYPDGTSVTFIIGNYYAFETGTWETGLNISLSLTASTTLSPTITPVSTPTPIPTPTMTPTPTPTPVVTPLPVITPTPTPATTGTQVNIGRLVGLAIFGIVILLLLAVLGYMVWRFYFRREEQP